MILYFLVTSAASPYTYTTGMATVATADRSSGRGIGWRRGRDVPPNPTNCNALTP